MSADLIKLLNAKLELKNQETRKISETLDFVNGLNYIISTIGAAENVSIEYVGSVKPRIQIDGKYYYIPSDMFAMEAIKNLIRTEAIAYLKEFEELHLKGESL